MGFPLSLSAPVFTLMADANYFNPLGGFTEKNDVRSSECNAQDGRQSHFDRKLIGISGRHPHHI